MDCNYYTKIGVADEQLEVPFDGTIYTRCQSCGKEVRVSVSRGHHMESEFCESCKALGGLLRAIKEHNVFGLCNAEEVDPNQFRAWNESGRCFLVTLAEAEEAPKE